ncbi:MAG: biopolymer transporter ExbD [Myxococcota bacterium]|jgi:biopolymer transport protein ExbD|nr:biopolymer transporter ExbD [Myxococcota bacterium]
MAGGGGGGDNSIEDINVTPLVDIMLCLMVIFMIAAALVVAAPKAIEVDLPKASSGRSVEEPSTFAVVYDEKEQVYVNGEKMSWEAFRAEVRRRKAEDEKVQAVISASSTLSYGRVMRLIDAIRVDGVERYALNIESDPEINPKGE